MRSLDDLKPLRLLVAVDGSMGSIKAIHRAAELAKDAVAHEVVIVHVMETRDQPTLAQGDDPVTRETKANLVLEEMMKVATSTGLEAKGILLKGNPVQAVLDHAEKFMPNMILVGSKGIGGSRTTKIGHIAAAIGNRAKHPVLIVQSD